MTKPPYNRIETLNLQPYNDSFVAQKILYTQFQIFRRAAFPRWWNASASSTPVGGGSSSAADKALQEHFGCSLRMRASILWPFTQGFWTFPVAMESGLIPPDMPRARSIVMSCIPNEIVLLAYYIAAINIEEAYHPWWPESRINVSRHLPDGYFHGLNENGWQDRWPSWKCRYVEEQKRRTFASLSIRPIQLSAGQNPNATAIDLKYPNLDKRIAAATYQY